MKTLKSSLFCLSHLGEVSIVNACVLLTLLAASVAMAQQPSEYTSPPTVAKKASDTVSSVPQTDGRYRIGPGDVLEIRVFNRPLLSRDAVRVEESGMIRMPLIEGELQASCRTEGELAGEIKANYRKYLRNPQVDVFIKEYNSQPVSVIGAVHNPTLFKLQRRVRLSQLLSFAGGPSERAGRSVQVVHGESASRCEASVADDSSEDAAIGFVSYNLEETMKGNDKSNPYVQPGDVINVTEAEQAYVIGNVVTPRAIPLKETITVSRAIAMANGTLPDTKSDGVRIVRQIPGNTGKTEIPVDLKKIEKRSAEDIVLQAGDVVNVPTASGKRFLKGLFTNVVGGVGQLPVRVIP